MGVGYILCKENLIEVEWRFNTFPKLFRQVNLVKGRILYVCVLCTYTRVRVRSCVTSFIIMIIYSASGAK